MKYCHIAFALVLLGLAAGSAAAQEIDTHPLEAPVLDLPMPTPQAGAPNASPILPAEKAMVVILQGLDKITARVSTIELAIGSSTRFGTLDIMAQVCHKRPPEDSPETTVFLEIRESREGKAAVLLFNGWMFASSPALSALEHPVYDVWVVDCVELG
jgi:hypothetical protein